VSRVFPKNSRTIAAKALLGLMLLTMLITIGVTYYATPKYTRVGYAPIQPIAFSHELHVGQLGMDCRYCHTHVEESAIANIPTTDTCLTCHAADRANILPDSPLLAPLREAQQTGQPIDWIKVHRLPDFQYFDHAVHVARGVSCISCHGQVEQMEVVRHVEPMSMAWCLDCHRNPEPHLRPAEEVTNMWWDPERDPILRSQGRTAGEWARDVRAHAGINPPTTCTGCHR
jgi:hypothetical protein